MNSPEMTLLSEHLEREKEYWLGKLSGHADPAGLPPDFARPPGAGPRAGRVEATFAAATADKLYKAAGANTSLAFTILVAALKVCLHKYTGEEEITVGATIHKRHAEDAALNRVLALRDRVSGAATVRQLLADVKQTLAGAYAHQKFPYGRLCELLGAPPAGGREPLFDVVILLEEINDPAHAAHLNNDLTLIFSAGEGRLTAAVEYRPELFEPGAVELFTRRFELALNAMLDQPDREISALGLLADGELEQLLYEFNATASDYPRDLTIHQLFARQAALTPDAVAVVHGSRSLTYRELDERADLLAAGLRERGVAPERVVALCLERSFEMVVALLAVLKAGGAYLPLDPADPPSRLRGLLADSGAILLLSESRLAARLPETETPTLLLDEDAAELSRARGAEPAAAVAAEAAATNLAYVLFTSGSTGRPKAVCVPHRAVLRLVRGTGYAEFGPSEVFLQMAPLAFDASTFEIWGALLNGGRLVIMPAGTPSLDDIAAALRDHGVTTLWLTAGLFHLMAERRPESLRGLRQLLAGGDVLSPARVREFVAGGEAPRLINGYGPTEGTTFTCCHEVQGAGAVGASVPIGRPIANTRVYVLDAALRPAPAGMRGELYIGGDGVARGYLGRPALTAERFVPDPFSEEPGARLYRSGDETRWRGDGVLEFLGRRDGQVKVRGFRVELGEVEAALREHSDVSECAVVVRADESGEPRLVGYVAGRAGHEVSGGELREYLAGRAPAYMTPAVIVVLDSLPLKENGKVDRGALPEVSAERRSGEAEAPVGEVEAVVARLWEHVLGVEGVGRRENFFEVGGHSLRATQLMSRVRETFGVHIPLVALFERPTVADLAAAVEDALRAGSGLTVPPVARSPRTGPLPLSFAQQRLWFLDRLLPEAASYNVPVAYRIEGELDAGALERSLNRIVERHEALRTTISIVGTEPSQIVRPESPLKLEHVDLAGPTEESRAEAVRREIEGESRRPFDLGAGPVIRARLLRLAPAEHVLVITMHHIVADGWSVGVLARELSAFYEAEKWGGEARLPELPVQYADYAAWQRAWLQGEELERQLGYWRGQLAEAPTVLELPADHPRPKMQTGRGGVERFEVGEEALAGLKSVGREEGATLFMTLLAAFGVFLSRYSGRQDILIGAPIANRGREEFEGLVGFFSNTLVLRARVEDDPSFRALLRRARTACLGAYAHQDVPFEALVEELQPERDLSRSPLFQVVLTLQNAPLKPLELTDLGVSRMKAHTETAKFDLGLNVYEEGSILAASFEYNRDIFEPETVRGMVERFHILLEGIIKNPEQPVSELPFLKPSQLQYYTGEWNETAADYPLDRCVHHLVAEQAARTPAAVAVAHESRRLTYAELDADSNRLARYLVSRGVGAGSRVAVMLEHSPLMVVAVLGVLKTGAAYVPLEPGHPPLRLAFQLEDSEPALLLTERSLLGGVAASGVPAFLIDAQWEELKNHEPLAPEVEQASTALAYMIYTSGSTGRPKGVKVTHRSLLNYVCWAADQYLADGADSFALYSSLAFDLTVTSLFAPLITGRRVVVYAREGRESPVLRVFEEGAVEVVKLTPSHLALVAGLDNRRGRIRRLVVGGESLDSGLARRAWDSFGGRAEIVNEYGPTEATVGCMIHRYDPARDEGARVPVGRPAANAHVYVVDARGREVGEGVAGELLVSGEGVAEGYYNRAELTAERFTSDPYRPGARAYRTGDVARRLSGGAVDYLGRRDEQVKHHGHRVELGELRAAVNSHPEVRDSVVRVMRREAAGASVEELVCYYVARRELDAKALREHLRERVIEETVPHVFVHLRKLPLTLSGKVNHEALPDPWGAGAGAGAGAREASETERALAGVWAEVLGVGEVGRGENFFELGGHSLLATLVVMRVEELFGVGLALRAVFEAPTVEKLAALIDAARKEKESEQQEANTGRIPRVGREQPLPLSFAQQRLWFLNRLAPDEASYNAPIAYSISGRLDVAALEESLNRIVERHEALRTTVALAGGEPVQVVSPHSRLTLQVGDLSDAPPAGRLARARAEVEEEGRRPFDLAAGPVIRARLLRLTDEEHVLVVTMHHIVSDGWSVGVFERELAAFYAAFSRGEAPPLAELPIQYADYAAWQRGWLRGEELERQLGYWRGQLAGAPTVLELPADRPRPKVQTSRGAFERFEISADVISKLGNLSQQENATLFMTLLAAFGVLLSRHAGQKDLLVGTPIANRGLKELEGLIGFFANTLVLRNRVEDDASFRALVRQAREVCLGAYAHQDLPFEKLVEELQPERDLSRPPLFQVAFALQNSSGDQPHMPGLSLKPFRADTHTAKFELLLNLFRKGEGVAGGFEYNADLFDAETIKRLIKHFQTLLQNLADEPDREVADVSMLTEEEARYFVYEWNETAAAYPLERRVHDLIAEQAARTPDATAVSHSSGSLTYRELDERASRLAAYLAARGVGPESRVAVMLEHSPLMVVAVLGVLKTGAAYVPLEPGHPPLRLAFQLEDSRPALLLTERALAGAEWAAGAPALLLDSQWDEVEQYAPSAPLALGSDAIAYVIYTSGSTGRPKGVKVTHRSLLNYVCWAADQYLADGADSFALYSSLAFDLTVTSLFAPLVTGRRVVVYAREGRESPILRVFEEGAVEVVKLTPSHLSLVAGLDNRRGRIRRLVVGGESLDSGLARRAWDSFGGRVDIVNEYGPTEATVGCMIHRYDPARDEGARVPIGRPAANAHVYVVDARGREVGEGVAGELLVSGEGVAEGYYNRAELTAERFTSDPYRAGARAYRTGDVARRLSGGAVDYLGRRDEQVKHHGHRVELGELRAAVNSHPEVRDSVVRVMRREAAGAWVEELVCYYVARRELDAKALREHLRERVIEETVPHVFVHLRKLPLTLSGKVNHEALPDPWGAGAGAGAATREASETERALAGVWAEVLGVGEVGRGENFFELGGHSLLATLVVMRVEELFGVGLALRAVFEAPTVEKLAAVIDAAVREKAGVATPPLIPAQRSGPLPLSFAQQRLWFLDRMSPEAASYNVPVAYRVGGRLDVAALERSLNRIVERHEILRTTITLAAGEPVQVVSPNARLTLQLADLGDAPPAERLARARAEVEEEGRRPFDLERGPVVRARLLRLADEEHVLVITMHHIVSDAWSVGVFVRELSAFYEAEAGGGEARLPALPVQYADYAAWQRGWLRGEELERQLGYWRGQLAGAPTVLELPADRPRPKVQTSRGALEQFEVGGEVLAGLKAVAREEGATLFMTLLAAFGVLLSRYTGRKDFLLGAPIANRGQKELEGLVGFFANTLALRMQIEENISFRALVRRVRETCLGAYAHQDVPFEAVVEELQPERDLSRPPLFQITFAVQSDPGELPSPAGLTLTPLGFDTGTSKFEISAAFSETKNRLSGVIQYNTGLFEQETVARLASHLTVLLEHAVERAGDAISELPLLTRVEVEEALVQWNQTETEYPSGRPAQRLFEEQAARRPDAVALVSAAGRLTYGQLNRRANRLARRLRASGLGAGESVAVYLERGPESVEALLGVLKAGGACLLLDPATPKPELTRMLAAARPHMLLTRQKLTGSLPEWRGAVVSVDEQWEEAAGEDGGDFDGGARPDGVALVLFERESGSGYAAAEHTHEAVCNGVLWMRHALRLGAESRVLHRAAAAGVWAAWWEVLPTLSSGGALVLAEAGRETDAAYLSALVREHGVTVAHFAPALLEDFLDECGLASCASLTHVLCSAAPLPRELQDKFRGALGAELHNLYAPAAAAFAAAHWVCRAEDGAGVAPAGRPIANGRLYVLDADMRPAPVGVTGRLYLGGRGLARGFLSEAGSTGGSFAPDPFSRQPGSRLLDTGEAARYRPDGSVERLADAGPQVNVRGYGVALNEVEAHLRAHPDVARGACLAVDDGRGGKRLVAYIVPAAGHDPEATADEARAFLNERLPDYAVPADYVTLAALPLAADGTLDRAALPAPAEAATEAVFVAPVTETEQVIAALWREYLGADGVGVHDNFFDLGGHSILLAQLHVRLTELYGNALTIIDLFRYPTVSALAARLGERLRGTAGAAVAARAPHAAGAAVASAPAAAEAPENAVAIIGMAVRLPGCRNVEDFWEKLRAGAELISFFSEEELAAEGTSPELLKDPNYVRASAFLADADHFDAPFFGIRPREAEAIDPQQRQFLECAWEALEDACYDPERYEGRVGVYAGVGMSTYFNHVSSDPELMRALGGFQAVLSNDKDFLPMRVSYKLNLRGPSVSVQTSCSTSLVAVHMACRSLLAGECDIALSGGVTIRARKHGYLHQEGGITSPDGHCRAFDAAAAGTVPGNGVGVVVLKRLRDALADGDRVEAVIIGSAINNDGSLKVGFTAPSIEGQAKVIAGAHAAAGVSPETITYVEAHGTGTALGDPIEVAALTQAFRSRTQKKAYCGLGSVKTNVGHLDAAAGVCGLVKTVLALKHRELPPSLHYREANPQIDFAGTPFYVNTSLRPWETAGAPRRAGVSSFGIGGTNAHVILEEAPPAPADAGTADGPQLLVISAKTPAALEAATANLRARLKGGGEFSLRDVAYSLQVGRAEFEHRRAVVARGREEAAAALESLDARSVFTAAEKLRDRPVALIFPGQGAQHVGMGAGLYESYPVFREQVDGCCELLKRHMGTDLRDIIYPRGGHAEEAARLLEQTANAQPALFVIEYAAARLWGELGVRPQAMLGHSVGEYVAACLSGVFSLEEALMLVARRGQLVQSLPAGRMVAVHLPERELEPLLGGGLCVAAVNGPELCVVSGPADAADELCRELERREVECHPLHTSHAFHSEMVEPIIGPFVELVKQVELKPPRTPYVSNLTGTWVKPSQAMDPHYWGDHLRRVVRFSDGLQELLADARAVVLEVGPGAGLSGLVRRHPARAEGQEVLASMRRPKERQTDEEFLLRTLGALWLRGVRVEWAGLHGGARPRRLRLPVYPFERRRYWVAPPAPKAAESRPAEPERVNGGAPERAESHGHAPAPAALVRVEQPPAPPAAAQARAAAPPPGNGHAPEPTPTQQIIAQQLRISSAQLRLMRLQLETLRHGNGKTGR